jgi:hypothetical protein
MTPRDLEQFKDRAKRWGYENFLVGNEDFERFRSRCSSTIPRPGGDQIASRDQARHLTDAWDSSIRRS